MFNRQFFAASLETRIVKDKLSLRQAATRSGVSTPTLSRLLHGALPDMESFEKLAAWLKRDPGIFFALPAQLADEPRELDTVPQIVTLLRMDQALPEEAREKLVDLVKAAYTCLVIADSWPDHQGLHDRLLREAEGDREGEKQL